MENIRKIESVKNIDGILQKQNYNRSEAAAYCGVSIVTIDRALREKKLACFRIGRRVVISKNHLNDFLSRNEFQAKTITRRGQI